MAGKPNVVFIVGDNVGWGDVGCYGGNVPTPRINALAAEGIQFKNYNVECQCTPTRSALLSGRLPVRTGNFTVPLPGQGDYGLAPWEYTTAELFSDAGYATAHIGKWHLGDVEGRLPTDQGFDEWYGIRNSSDEWAYSAHPLFAESGHPVPKIWEGKKGSLSEEVADLDRESRQRLDEQIALRAADFIKREAKAGKPFFVNVCFTHIHPPFIHHPDFTGRSGGGMISDILAELDYRTGQVLDAIDEAGIADDTIVVWTSDNPGVPAFFGSNGPWRGTFASGFEGSMRVPGMIRWPGKIKAGVVTDEILSCVDWLPTLAGLVGESDRVPTDRPIDGVNAARFLLGKSDTTGRDHILYFGSDAGLMSVKWKTIKVVLRYADTFTGPIVKPQIPMMFDLVDDPAEAREIFGTRMDCGWMMMPVFERVGAFQRSVAKFPNIKPGEEFEGYPSNSAAHSERTTQPAY